MSRKLDITKPLSADEIKYMLDRDMWRELRQYCANMGLEMPVLPDKARIRGAEPLVGVGATVLPDPYKALALVGEKQAEKAAPDPDAQPPSAPSGVMHGPEGQFPPQTPQPSATVPSERTDWSKLTVDQLKEELDSRREEAQKEDPPDTDALENLSYTKDDRKDDLVTKLNLDDEAIARAAEEDNDG